MTNRIAAIYTDGACSRTHGGWAVIIPAGEEGLIIQGGEPDTTNNRMEIIAFMEALKVCIKHNITPDIFSDSEYVVKSYNGYLAAWVRKGWRKADGKEVKNEDLWREIHRMKAGLSPGPRLLHVKGHNGHALNEAADEYAVKARLIVEKTGKAFRTRIRTRNGEVVVPSTETGSPAPDEATQAVETVRTAPPAADDRPQAKESERGGILAFRILVERHKSGKMTLEDLYDELSRNREGIFGS